MSVPNFDNLDPMMMRRMMESIMNIPMMQSYIHSSNSAAAPQDHAYYSGAQGSNGCPLPGCYSCIIGTKDPEKRKANMRKYLKVFAEKEARTKHDRELLEIWVISVRRETLAHFNAPLTPLLKELVQQGLIESFVGLIGRQQELISPYALETLSTIIQSKDNDTISRVHALRNTIFEKAVAIFDHGMVTERKFCSNVLTALVMQHPSSFTSLDMLAQLTCGLAKQSLFSMKDFMQDFQPRSPVAWQYTILKPRHDLAAMKVYGPRYLPMLHENTIGTMSFLSPVLAKLYRPDPTALPADRVRALVDATFAAWDHHISDPHLNVYNPENPTHARALTMLLPLIDFADTFDVLLVPDRPTPLAELLLPRLAEPAIVDKMIAAIKHFFKIAIVGFNEKELNHAVESRNAHLPDLDFTPADIKEMLNQNTISLLTGAHILSILCMSGITARAMAANPAVLQLLDFLWTKSCVGSAHTLKVDLKKPNPRHMLIFTFLNDVHSKRWIGVDGEYVVAGIYGSIADSVLTSLAHLHYHCPDLAPPLSDIQELVSIGRAQSKPDMLHDYPPAAVYEYSHYLRLTLPVRTRAAREIAIKILKSRANLLEKLNRTDEAAADRARAKSL